MTEANTNPIEAARLALIARLQAMADIPKLPVSPAPIDFYGVSAHVREMTNAFDEWLYAIGGDVANNSTVGVDMKLFSGAYLGAVDGNATFEIDEVAEACRRARRAA